MRSFAAVLVIFMIGVLALLVWGTLIVALVWNEGRVNISVNYWGEGWGEVGLVTLLLLLYPWAVLKRVRQ